MLTASQLRALKYERMKLRHALFQIDPKYKKKKLYAEDESDLDDDAIAEHEEHLKEKEFEKVEKKFVKDNEKLAEEGKEQWDDSVLKQRRKEVEEDFKKLKKERGTGKATLKRERPTEKIEEAIAKLDDKMKTFWVVDAAYFSCSSPRLPGSLWSLLLSSDFVKCPS